MTFLDLLLVLFAIGCITGVLSGLLGIGGGLLIVPVLLWVLHHQGFPEVHLMHIALGTSMATIIVTSVASAHAHHLRHNVRWDIVRQMAPAILLGAWSGAWLASSLNTELLKVLFILFALYVGTQFLFGTKTPARQAPITPLSQRLVGGLIGAFSNLVGIGGGTFTVPFLIYSGVDTRLAVGTSAAIGFPIAIAGTAGFITAGWAQAPHLMHCLGYIYYPGVIGLTLGTMLTVRFGAHLTQKLPVATIKKIFGLLLYGLAIKMAASLLS